MLRKLLNLSRPNCSTEIILVPHWCYPYGLHELKITMSMTAIIIIITAGNDSKESCSQLISLFCSSTGPGLNNKIGKAWEGSQKPGGSTSVAQPGRVTISPTGQMTNTGSNHIS